MSTKRSAKILIVEDDILTAKAIELSVKNMGYDVVGIAACAEDAFQNALQTQPDLILMDIILKGPTDGVHATQRIQSQLDIPVVFLTAHSDVETMKRVLHSEPYGFVVKPFKLDELHETIEKALHRHATQLDS